VRQMAVLMSRCDCVVCNDGGPLHVAVASGARTVSIFGPSDEKAYGPYPGGRGHRTVTGDIECRPCYRNFRLPDCDRLDCLRRLDPRDVFYAVMDTLKDKSIHAA
jgi:ADP-heptose:LPS heptosyltransferase